MDDDKAWEGDDAEPGKTRQWKPTRRGVRGFTSSAAVRGCRRRRAWPAVGIVGGGEASAAAQPAMRGRSRRHNRRCFGRLEQEDQRLKKHYGRWMDIVRSLELESFLLTKLRKPFVRVNLVGPQVSPS